MTIGEKQIEQIVVSGDGGEVLAVISDSEIIEKTGVSVALDELA